MTKIQTLNYQVGGAIGYSVNKNIRITLGALYSQQGQNYADYSGSERDTGTAYTSVNYTFSRKVELTYLKVPIQFYYSTNENKKYSFTCYVGFYAGYLLKYMDSFDLHGSNSSGSLSWADTATGNSYHEYYKASFPWYYGKANATYSLSGEPYKKFDFGQTLGAGLQKKLSPNVSFLVMINYQIGFINIKNSDSQYSVNNSSQKFWNYFGQLDPNQFLSFYNSLFGISAGFKVKL